MIESREHRAHATRYEKQLIVPCSTPRTRVRDTVWRLEEICAAQWQALQESRATDRERRARRREHDRTVERELQTMPATRSQPDRIAMDATVIVTWSNGRATRHTIRGLPDVPAEELAEMLEQDLASYVDDEELTSAPDDGALG